MELGQQLEQVIQRAAILGNQQKREHIQLELLYLMV